ncbi:MAG: response regulator [Patescibacteria group bacterium]|nr:response regulator [Patescibacteria group bacterium]
MKKILIVEDDPMLLEIYQKKFLDYKYDILTASTGIEALQKIRIEKPELVLLDLVLPEEDGFEVLKKIKQSPRTKDIKVIIFSNLSQVENKQKATELSADGFITKSDYTPREIIEEVGKVLLNKAKK